jgi:hypothetical protein
MGKGDKNRVSNMRAYWNSPLWDKKIPTDTVDLYKPKRFLLLDDMRNPENCYIHDENKTLQQVSGIDNKNWDVVRTYEEFVNYIEKYGIPHVVSFDNDLVEKFIFDIPEADLIELYSMMNWKASKYKTGAHCAEWLVERCKSTNHPLPTYYVHSANTAARPIIKSIMEAARPLIKH